jgi:uncharacterized protein YdcH (DUF465 family)
MSAGHHDLAAEFPEFKGKIHTLKISDNHFKRLFDEYEALCKQLHRYDEGAGAIADESAENMKKQRLALKDQLFDMLKKAA